jgi:hypothetical protein
MGRVVGGDAVDGAVGDGGDGGAAVLLAAQRRRHLGEGAVVADGKLVEREVMRRRIAGDLQAALLGAADAVDGGRGGQMGRVIAAAGQLHQMQVALQQHHFRGRGNARQSRRVASSHSSPASASVGSSGCWMISAGGMAVAQGADRTQRSDGTNYR